MDDKKIIYDSNEVTNIISKIGNSDIANIKVLSLSNQIFIFYSKASKRNV